MVGNIITQGVSVAVGLPPKFSWQSVSGSEQGLGTHPRCQLGEVR